MTKIFNNLTDRVEAVSDAIKNYDGTLADLVLRNETTSVYHQEHLHSLKLGLQDALHNVEKDVSSVISDLEKMRSAVPNYCQFCGKAFQSIDHLKHHEAKHHSPQSEQHNLYQHLPGTLSVPLPLPNCNFCGLVFSSPEAVRKHIVECHVTPQLPEQLHDSVLNAPSVTVLNICDYCGLTFMQHDALTRHVEIYHSPNSLTTNSDRNVCGESGSVRNILSDITTHTCSHREDWINCSASDNTSSIDSTLNSHTATNHEHIPISPICQLDGQFDVSNPAYMNSSVSDNVRTAPYTLNRTKQVSKLVSDAAIKDFELNVSPTEQNINIVCSTGFYSLVVLPVFSEIFNGFSTIVHNVNILCYDVTKKVDATKAHVNTVIFLKLSPAQSARSNNVTITLHHTVRRVQIQGSSIMNNKIRANVWFLENILLKMLNNVAASKSFNIAKLNTLVQNVVANHVKKHDSLDRCKGCEIPFNGRSQSEQCFSCGHRYHKKCLAHTSHQCSLTPLLSSISPPDVSQPSVNLPVPNRQQPRSQPPGSVATTRCMVLTIPAVVSTSSEKAQTTHCPSPSLQDTHISQPPTTDLNEPGTHHQHSLAPGVSLVGSPLAVAPMAPVYTTANTIQGSILTNSLSNPALTYPQPRQSTPNNQTATNTVKDRNSKKVIRGPPIDEHSFEIECLKKQLNIAHSKIKEIETELEKSNNTNHILSERIKLFEGSANKDIYEKYFPSTRTQTDLSSKSLCASHCPAQRQHHCCAPPPCCAHACHTPAGGVDIVKVIRELSSTVLRLGSDISDIRAAISDLSPQQSDSPTSCTAAPDISCSGPSKDSIFPSVPGIISSPVLTTVRTVSSIPTTTYGTTASTAANPPPLSPDVVVVESSPCLSPPVQDMTCMSDNTIDENVPDDLTEAPLNSHPLTTQLNH